jgi:hypothetical protein
VRNLYAKVLVLRSFIKCNIPGRAPSLAVFAVFQRFISDRFLVLRGIPRPWPFRNLKNSEVMAVPPLFFAVFWLFAVFVTTIATFASGHYAESLSEVEDTR